MFAEFLSIAFFDSILVKEQHHVRVQIFRPLHSPGEGGTFTPPRDVVFTQIYATNDQILCKLGSFYRLFVLPS